MYREISEWIYEYMIVGKMSTEIVRVKKEVGVDFSSITSTTSERKEKKIKAQFLFLLSSPQGVRVTSNAGSCAEETPVCVVRFRNAPRTRRASDSSATSSNEKRKSQPNHPVEQGTAIRTNFRAKICFLSLFKRDWRCGNWALVRIYISAIPASCWATRRPVH